MLFESITESSLSSRHEHDEEGLSAAVSTQPLAWLGLFRVKQSWQLKRFCLVEFMRKSWAVRNASRVWFWRTLRHYMALWHGLGFKNSIIIFLLSWESLLLSLKLLLDEFCKDFLRGAIFLHSWLRNYERFFYKDAKLHRINIFQM